MSHYLELALRCLSDVDRAAVEPVLADPDAHKMAKLLTHGPHVWIDFLPETEMMLRPTPLVIPFANEDRAREFYSKAVLYLITINRHDLFDSIAGPRPDAI
jgi:hypothetical protein